MYRNRSYSKSKPSLVRKLTHVFAVIFILGLLAVIALWAMYSSNLKAVGGPSTTVSVTIPQGASVASIAAQLKTSGLIRSTKAFEYYARWHNASKYLEAGTYDLTRQLDVPTIVSHLTHGKVATSLVTILPGQRLDQIRQSLIEQGFSPESVDAALQPQQYENSPILVDKPAGNSLEGYLYPDSFQRTSTTTAKAVVEQSILQLQNHLTPAIKEGFAKQGLTLYQGLIIASIVEQEVIHQSDRAQAAQVFIKRFRMPMSLGSDVTAFYGSVLAGKGKDVTYDTPYNTRLHTGLPPTPISNISASSLAAVANPAPTDWLFFVAGDDGTTYFSRTVQEHEALTAKYCHKLCQ
ncbi:MAG: endolytic transglycosylase MltG [Candidatus Saccharimonadales bacterium]